MGSSDKLVQGDAFPYPYPPKIVLESGRVEHISITDTTLREGQQAFRPFTAEEALAIHELLSEISGPRGVVKSAELFLYTKRDREIAKVLLDSGLEYPKPVAWIRAVKSDIDLVAEAGLDEAVILCSSSDYHIRYKLGLSRREAAEKYLEAIEYALEKGIKVRCSLEDSTRADVRGFLVPFATRARELGEKYGIEVEFKLADTLGVGLPFSETSLPRSVPKLVRALISAGIPGSAIEFHGHNDFGLAVANHLAAWIAGASMSNCTLLGIGERAGNCPLELMALAYVGLRGTDDGMNLRALGRIAALFESMGYEVPESQPLVGSRAFATKAGIHIDGLMKNPAVYLPFDPLEVLGVPIRVFITPHSGRAGIAYWISTKYGLSYSKLKSDPRVGAIYEAVLSMFDGGRVEPLSDEEMEELVAKYMPELRGVQRVDDGREGSG